MRIDRKETAAILLKQDDILILCHRNPDGDTLGSGYALHHAFKQLGKRSQLLCSDPIPPKMRYLKGHENHPDFTPRFVMSVDIADEQLFGEALTPYRGKVDLAIDHHPSNSMFARETFLDDKAAATCEIIYRLLLNSQTSLQAPTELQQPSLKMAASFNKSINFFLNLKLLG